MTSAKATKDEVCSEPLSPALLFLLPEPHIHELVCIVNSHDSMPEKSAKVIENKDEGQCKVTSPQHTGFLHSLRAGRLSLIMPSCAGHVFNLVPSREATSLMCGV